MTINSNIKRFIPLFIITLSLLITFILALLRTDEKKVDKDEYIPNVKSHLVESSDFRIYVESSSHISPKTIYPLNFGIYGEILFLSPFFTNESIFNKGDTLLKIDSTDYSIARINAKFKLDEAELELSRQEAIALRSESEISDFTRNSNVNDLARNKPQLERAKSLALAAKANYEKTESDLIETVFVAPFKGRIINSTASLGLNVMMGMNLGTIYSVDEMIVRLPLSVDDLDILGLNNQNKLKNDIKIQLSAKIGDSDKIIEAEYLGFSGNINKFSQKINVTGLIENFSDLDIPVDNNVFFNAKIYGPIYENIFSIPNIAIHNDSYVYVINDGKIYKREIQLLKKYDSVSIVKSGLKDGEIINMTRMDYYLDGMKVNLLKVKWKR